MAVRRRSLAIALSTAALVVPGLVNVPSAHATALVVPAASSIPRASDGWSVIGAGPEAGPSTLYLVSPTNARYRLGNLAKGWIVSDVSNQGQRLLLRNVDGNQWAVYDAATRKANLVSGTWLTLRFSNPGGPTLLGELRVGTSTRLVKATLTGSVKYVISGVVNVGGDLVQSVDGKYIVANSPRNRAQLAIANNATGKLIRTLPLPARASECTPVGMWDRSHVTGYCGDGSQHGVYTWPLAGGKPTLRAASSSSDVEPMYAVPSSRGNAAILVESGFNLRLARVGANKTTFAPIAGPKGSMAAWLTHTRGYFANYQQNRAIYSYSLATGKTVLIGGGGKDRAGLTTFAPIDAYR